MRMVANWLESWQGAHHVAVPGHVYSQTMWSSVSCVLAHSKQAVQAAKRSCPLSPASSLFSIMCDATSRHKSCKGELA